MPTETSNRRKLPLHSTCRGRGGSGMTGAPMKADALDEGLLDRTGGCSCGQEDNPAGAEQGE